jgi:hypothetical protein
MARPEADYARFILLREWKFAGQDADEDDVVDAEDDLEHGEGDQRKRGFSSKEFGHPC